MITSEIISIILGSSLVSGFSTWIFARKKNAAETKVVEGDAIEKMQTAYSKLVQDMDQRFEQMKRRIDDLEKELKECMEKHILN